MEKFQPRNKTEREILKRQERGFKRERVIYTTIFHKIRKDLKLSVSEYCVADTIYTLSNSPTAKKMGGWCFATKQTIARSLEISKRSVEKAINNLIKSGLIEKDPETRHLKTTDKWYYSVEVQKERLRRL